MIRYPSIEFNPPSVLSGGQIFSARRESLFPVRRKSGKALVTLAGEWASGQLLSTFSALFGELATVAQ